MRAWSPNQLEPRSPRTVRFAFPASLALVLCVLARSFTPALSQNLSPAFGPGEPIGDLELADLATAQVFVLADTNGDSFPDIVTAGFSPDGDPAVIVLLNDSGGFGEPAYYIDEEVDELDEPVALEVADVGSAIESDSFGDPDGNADILVLDASAELLIVLWGDGGGGFRFSGEAERLDLADFVEGELVGLSAGDFDGGNGRDIAVLDSGSEEGQLFFFCNRPRAPYLSCETSEAGTQGEEPVALSTGDIDGSGATDVVVLNSAPANGTLVVFRGDGQGNFHIPTHPPVLLARPNATHLTAARIDDDGIDDVAVSYIEEFAGDSLQVFLGGSRLVPRPVTEGVAFAPLALASGDFNADGRTDLVAAQAAPYNDSFVMLGDGRGGFSGCCTSPGILTGPAIAVSVADLDSDGDADFVIARADRSGFRIALNAPVRPEPTPTETPPMPTPTPTGIAATPTVAVATPTPAPPSTSTAITETRATPTPTRTSSPTLGPQPSEPTDDDGCSILRTRNGGSAGLLPMLAGGAIFSLPRFFRHRAREKPGFR